MTTRHQLLVSVPDLGDDNFDRTVVYMLDHDEDGAMGLVLNRPTSSEVDEHLEELPLPVSSPGVFFMGGPVSVGGLLALGLRQIGADLEHAVVVDGPVVMVEPEALLEGRVGGVDSVRFYTGYSGWSGGQLEGELEAGVWHVVEAMPDDVFCHAPDTLWRNVMRRQGGRLASIGLYPDDPALN